MKKDSFDNNDLDAEDMTVEIELESGEVIQCAIITILEVEEKDYIVLLPLDESGENTDGEVWFYRYYEDENDVEAEPVLEYIEDDDEYETVAEAFDEYLDGTEFDELMDDDN